MAWGVSTPSGLAALARVNLVLGGRDDRAIHACFPSERRLDWQPTSNSRDLRVGSVTVRVSAHMVRTHSRELGPAPLSAVPAPALVRPLAGCQLQAGRAP